MKNTSKIVLICLLIFSHPAYSMDARGISEKYAESVLLIKTDRGTGTGFFVNSCGTIATCYHVIQGANTIQVRWNGEFTDAEVIHVERKYDQALLNIFRENTPYLPVQKYIVERIPDQLLKKSDMIFVMGYPFAAKELSMTMGKITAINYRYEEMGGVLLSGMLENVTYGTDAQVHPGNSGSPVFDMNGNVVGMAAAKIGSPKKEELSLGSLICSLDRLLFKKDVLFQSSVFAKGEDIVLHRESRDCLENTNPFYFRYVNCRRGTPEHLCYECANTSCGSVGYEEVFAGSFLGIPLYDSCRPTIIPRHFPYYAHSEKFHSFLQKIVSNSELKKQLEKRTFE